MNAKRVDCAMLIFIKNSTCVKASPDEVFIVLRKLAHKPTLFNSFKVNSFSFSMWEKNEYRNRYEAIRFFGNVQKNGKETIVHYRIWPGAVFLIGLLAFLSTFISGFILLLFSTVSMRFLVPIALSALIITITIREQEKVCDERLIGKMHELQIKNVQIRVLDWL